MSETGVKNDLSAQGQGKRKVVLTHKEGYDGKVKKSEPCITSEIGLGHLEKKSRNPIWERRINGSKEAKK